MAHDVFISYSHFDKYAADATCAALEAVGIRCWMARRDMRGPCTVISGEGKAAGSGGLLARYLSCASRSTCVSAGSQLGIFPGRFVGLRGRLPTITRGCILNLQRGAGWVARGGGWRAGRVAARRGGWHAARS